MSARFYAGLFRKYPYTTTSGQLGCGLLADETGAVVSL